MWRWDIFCTVIDNYGDIGTCWRLARQLAEEHGADVRLWVDNLQSFAQLCPAIATDAEEQRVGQIVIRRWPSDFPNVEAADVVIEAFACKLPASYIKAMTSRAVPPVWINLEYLSAETWVEGCHRLSSPQMQSSLTKFFFFPGFTPQTGGLLCERNLLRDRAVFDSAAEADFWRSVDIPARSPRELRVSMFCYQNAALPNLLQSWAEGRDAVTVLATPGLATKQVADWFGEPLRPGTPLRKSSLTAYALPFLPQPSFDRLLWACDVNFVRGEDSFVRAQWAGRPFVWHIYPQADEAHWVKLEAFLERYLQEPQPSLNSEPAYSRDSTANTTAHAGLTDLSTREEPLRNQGINLPVRQCWRAWNGKGNIDSAWQDFTANRKTIEQHGKLWADALDQMGDLVNNLVCFIREIEENQRSQQPLIRP